MTKGISSVKVANIMGKNDVAFRSAYKKLLAKRINYDKLLDMISAPENVDKFKSRLEHIITVKDFRGQTLVTMKAYNKTLGVVHQELGQIIKRGVAVAGNFGRLRKNGYSAIDLKSQDGSPVDYNTVYKGIRNVEVTLTLTKR